MFTMENSQKSLQCPFCLLPCTNQTILDSHLKAHRKYAIPAGPDFYRSVLEMEVEFRFNPVDEYKSLLLEKARSEKYVCSYCQQKFSSFCPMILHDESCAEPSGESVEEPSRKKPKINKAQETTRQVKQKSSVVTDFLKDNRKFICGVCALVRRGWQAYTEHVESKHSDFYITSCCHAVVSKEESERHTCKTNESQFPTTSDNSIVSEPSNESMHEGELINITRFHCRKCKTDLPGDVEFLEHLSSTHQKKNLFPCPDCSIAFEDCENLFGHDCLKKLNL